MKYGNDGRDEEDDNNVDGQNSTSSQGDVMKELFNSGAMSGVLQNVLQDDFFKSFVGKMCEGVGDTSKDVHELALGLQSLSDRLTVAEKNIKKLIVRSKAGSSKKDS